MQLKFLILAICVSAALSLPPAKEKHPREHFGESKTFTYIGAYGNLFYYIGFDAVNQEQARANCQLEDLKFVSIPSQDVLEYINDATLPSEDFSWTSGSSHFGNSAFHFDDGSEVNNAITINNPSAHPPTHGLVLDKYAQATTALRVATVSNVQYYLCSHLVTLNGENVFN